MQADSAHVCSPQTWCSTPCQVFYEGKTESYIFFSPKEYMTEMVTGLNCTSRAEKIRLRKQYKKAATPPQKLNVALDAQGRQYSLKIIALIILIQIHMRNSSTNSITPYSLNYRKIQVSRGTKKFPIPCTVP